MSDWNALTDAEKANLDDHILRRERGDNPMTDLHAIEKRHWPITIDGHEVCARDEGIWPCDAARLLVAVDVSHAEGLVEGARLEYREHRDHVHD